MFLSKQQQQQQQQKRAGDVLFNMDLIVLRDQKFWNNIIVFPQNKSRS